MRIILVLAICVLLVSCGPSPVDKEAARSSTTGKVIEDVYNPNHCLSDGACGPGQLCVNRTCVPKNQR